MAEEHEVNKMVQRALAGKLEPEENQALQKIGRKKQPKSNQLLIELPYLNSALIEAYRDLNHTTRANKKMAKCSKTARKQAKRATKLWQASENRIVARMERMVGPSSQVTGFPSRH